MLLRCYFASIYLNIAQTSHEQLQKQKFSLFSFKQKEKFTNRTNSGDIPRIAAVDQSFISTAYAL